jgi:hypothetical protein
MQLCKYLFTLHPMWKLTLYTAVNSAAGLPSAGLKPGQNAFERILFLGFAFAPDFMLLSAS